MIVWFVKNNLASYMLKMLKCQFYFYLRMYELNLKIVINPFMDVTKNCAVNCICVTFVRDVKRRT